MTVLKRNGEYQDMAPQPAHIRMMNKALDYLGRYASSQHKLAQILDRFAARKLADYDADEIAAARQQTIEQCVKLGYLNDQQFAAATARSQRRLGRSRAQIHQRLRQHALGDDIIKQALASADEDSADGEYQAAIRFAKRRRLGPFANRPAAHLQRRDAAQWHQRDLGAMARAGFSISISRQILDQSDPNVLDDWLEPPKL